MSRIAPFPRLAFLPIPLGAYEVRASRVGYARAAVTEVVVKAGRLTPLDIALEAAPFEAGRVSVRADYFSRTIESRTSSTGLTYEELRRAPGDVGRGWSRRGGATSS